jgi:hypothetical protein
MDLNTLGEEELFHLLHELKGQMTVVKHKPLAGKLAESKHLEGRLFLLFSHRYLVGGVLLLLLGELVNY